MKFQLKALAAAVVLSASSLSAQAAMTNTASGDSSIVLTLLDTPAGISATFDLGYSYSSFASMVAAAASAPGSTLTWDLTTGYYADAWSTFSNTASVGNTKWAVIAGDNAGSGASRNLLTTKNSADVSSQSSGTLRTQLTELNNYINNNNAIANHNVSGVDNGANIATPQQNSAYANNYYGSGKFATYGQNAVNIYGEEMTVVNLNGYSLGTTKVTETLLGNNYGNYTFNMSSAGVLSFNVPVSAVPEADSYAMLLAGLGVLGLVARRRKA